MERLETGVSITPTYTGILLTMLDTALLETEAGEGGVSVRVGERQYEFVGISTPDFHQR